MFKIFIIFAVLCYLAADVHSAAVKTWPTKAEAIAKCSRDYKITEEQGEKYVSQKEKDTPENGECFMSCYMRARGYLLNGKINWQRLYEFHLTFITSQSARESLKEMFDECEAKADYKGKNNCEVAYEGFKC